MNRKHVMTRDYAHALLNAARDGAVEIAEYRITEALRVTGDLGEAGQVVHLNARASPKPLTSACNASLLAWSPA